MSNTIVREKIAVDKLQIGMYVCELDRPWLETPYPLQGFYIQSNKEIQDLLDLCGFVYIDVKLTFEQEIKTLDQNVKPAFSKRDNQNIYKVEYIDSLPMEEELSKISDSFGSFSLNSEKLIKELKSGRKINLKEFRASTRQMVESVIRNPDAVLWLAKLKQSDDYMYQHSLRCSVLSVAFGRQLGLTKRRLNNLAIGATLLDIGKLKLPISLLNRPGKLDDDEFEMIKDHVRLSLEMIENTGGDNRDILEMISCHHERMDGTGYPNQLSGDDIPLFGRIAAIVDCYDAICSTRSYAEALSPAEAIRKLYEWRGVGLHSALVEVFIQALGIYPAGSMVELSTGEVGVVMSEYRARRLRPKIMLILDENKQLYSEFLTIDLMKRIKTKDGASINIKTSLQPGSYGIDPSELLLG